MDKQEILLPIPRRFRRGSLRGDPVKSLESGLKLLDWIDSICPVANSRILDFGCGVKIAQSLVQRGSPQKLYVGLDVYKKMIKYLRAHIDDNTKYQLKVVPFQNDRYNPRGEEMSPSSLLPVDEFKFDILLLFSVITHMVPKDADAVLRLLRRYAGDEGRLLFWAFSDPDQADDFKDEYPERPLLRVFYLQRPLLRALYRNRFLMRALYRRQFLEELIEQAGWKIEKAISADTKYKKVKYICSPVGPA